MTIRTICDVCGKVVRYTDDKVQSLQVNENPDQFCEEEDHSRLAALNDVDIQFEDPVVKYESGSVESEYICGRLTKQIEAEQR